MIQSNVQQIEAIFGNVNDVHEMTVRFVRSLEDTVEMLCADTQLPLIGTVFYQELCGEGEELIAYEQYAECVMSAECLMAIEEAFRDPRVMRRIQVWAIKRAHTHLAQNRGKSFALVIRYVLPQLLQAPLFHCLEYDDYLKVLNICA
jgi:hypothetical protein